VPRAATRKKPAAKKPATKKPAAKKPAAKKPAAQKPAASGIERLGRIINGYSNALTMIAIDGAHASAYGGSDPDADDPNHPDDHDRAIDVGCGVLKLGKVSAVVAEVGGCGMADVYRIGSALVIAELYFEDEDVDAAAELDRVLAMHPTTGAQRCGTVDASSGVLVLMGQLDAGPKLALPKVKSATSTPTGVAIRVPPGRYDVWREQFGREVRGDWGSMHVRIRVVPAGTKVVNGTPIAELAQVAAAPSADGTRRLIDPEGEGAWASIHSIAVAADGSVFAGEQEGVAVAGWGPDGKLRWQRRPAPPPKKKDKHAREWASVQLWKDDLLAMCVSRHATALFALDPATGKTRRTLRIPEALDFQAVDDRLVLHRNFDTVILSYPAGKRLAELEHRATTLEAVVSPDRRWLALDDENELHVYDWKTMSHRHTIAHDKPSGYSLAMAFTADGAIVCGDNKAGLRFYDPASGKRLALVDAAAGATRKGEVDALATSAKHIAATRRDGSVVLLDRRTRKLVRRFDRHLVDSYAGQWSVEDVAFSPDGATLWVSAGKKGEPIGLTGYAI
jgi:WD40 repeat protein